MIDLIERIEALTEPFERELADAVLAVSVRANQAIVKELKGDERMCQALLELMEPEISLITEKAADEEAKKNAINMLKSGKFSPEEIQQYIPRLSVEEIKALAT